MSTLLIFCIHASVNVREKLISHTINSIVIVSPISHSEIESNSNVFVRKVLFPCIQPSIVKNQYFPEEKLTT